MSKQEAVLSNDLTPDPVLVELTLDEIHADEASNLRKYPASAKSVAELSNDIIARGQLQPVVVARNGSADNPQAYKLVAGFRRFAAIKLAAENGTELPVLARVVEADDRQAMLDNLAENIERESLSPIDMAIAIKTLRETQGMTVKDCARAFRKSEAWIRQVEPMLLLSPEKQKAIHKGEIPFGVARSLYGLTDEEQAQVIESVQAAITLGENPQKAARETASEIRHAKSGKKRKKKSGDTSAKHGVSVKAAVLAFERVAEEFKALEKTTKAQDRVVAAVTLVTKFLAGKLGEQSLVKKLTEELG